VKTTCKIFIYLSIIFGFYLIVPIIVGVIALEKLDTAKSKEDLKTIGILTLIFCSVIAGILMLCMDNDELKENDVIEDENSKDNKPIIQDNELDKNDDIIKEPDDNNTNKNDDQNESLKKELSDAKNLYDNKLIDEDEYKKMVSKIIDKNVKV
jgi:hypothetical protein